MTGGKDCTGSSWWAGEYSRGGRVRCCVECVAGLSTDVGVGGVTVSVHCELDCVGDGGMHGSAYSELVRVGDGGTHGSAQSELFGDSDGGMQGSAHRLRSAGLVAA